MSDIKRLVDSLKRMNNDLNERNMLDKIMFGEVISALPLQIKVDNRLIIDSDFIISIDNLYLGDKVIITRAQGGQLFAVLGRINQKIYWKDENAGGVSLTKASYNQPNLITINATNILTYAFDGETKLEELHWSKEINHDYVPGTNLRPHVHLYPTTNGAGNIKFFLEYWIKENGTAPVTGITSFVVASPQIAWEEVTVEFDDEIDGTDLGIGAQGHYRIYRNPTDAQDTYSADIAIGTLGYHFQSDSLGSRDIFIK